MAATSRIPGAPIEIVLLDASDARPVRVMQGQRVVVGRGSDCGVWVNDGSVSRQHAAIEVRPDGAFVEDLRSRHGTRVNGVPVRIGRPERIRPGDVVHFGPSGARIDAPRERVAMQTVAGEAESVRTFRVGSSGGAEHAMRVLMDVVRRIPSDGDEESAGRMLLDRLVAVTNLERGLFVRVHGGGGAAEVVATHGSRGGSVSRSVLAAAEDPQQVAHLSQTADLLAAESIAGSGVREVLCARIPVEGEERTYLYLDTRKATGVVDAAMAEFVGAAARISGLVFESFARRRLEDLRLDVERARLVQQRLLPSESGGAGEIRWSLRSKPGALLAGDFAGVAQRPDGSVLVWVGDVVGKGPAAAMLMASAQAWLYASAARADGVSAIVASLNEFLFSRSESSEFATLLVAEVKSGGRIVACDAGHALAFVVRGTSAERIPLEGGAAAGLIPGEEYGTTEFELGAGDRLVLLTDGVHEQRSESNEQFGFERIETSLARSGDPASDVESIVAELAAFAKTGFDDDVTILSLERR